MRCQGMAPNRGTCIVAEDVHCTRPVAKTGKWELNPAHTVITKPCALAMSASPHSPRGWVPFV